MAITAPRGTADILAPDILKWKYIESKVSDIMKEKIYEEIGENYYLLPSSIHEMIIVPESNSPSREHLNEMITEVNQTQVDEEEFLSDCVYYYNSSTKTLS